MSQNHKRPFSGFHSGFIALAGAPNAGKSTLLNRLLGTKLSITSPRPQTTRNRILGIVHREEAQLVFIDTPGIHAARRALNVRIVDAALAALAEVDMVVLIIDALRPDAKSETFLLAQLAATRKPVVLAVNKMDAVDAGSMARILERWSQRFDFAHIIPISALQGRQVEDLLAVLEAMLPEGPPFYGEDMLTDQAERFLVAEIVREKVVRLTGEEIPYAAAVTVDVFDETRRGRMVRITATIHVERDSQKGIVIGRGGRKLKDIGQAAREDIERLLGTRAYLELFVRVQKNWTQDTRALRKFGY
jgi:GTP-binding protein Era